MLSRSAVFASSSRPVFRSENPELERGSGSGMLKKRSARSAAPAVPRFQSAASAYPPSPAPAASAAPVTFPAPTTTAAAPPTTYSSAPPVDYSYAPPAPAAAAAPVLLPPPPQQQPLACDFLDGLNSEYLIDAATLALGRELGEGFFGVVHAGMWQGQPVAVKRLKQHVRKGELENFRAEVNVLGKLRHPNITAFYGVSQPPNAMIVTELLHGSLHDLVYSPASAKLSTRVWLRIVQDVAAGVGYLHGRSPPVIHRDLSSANVLVTGSVEELERDVDNLRRPLAKVSDFGLSRTVEWYMTSCVGNLFYLAPEVFKGEHYTEKVDVYSFAILLVELFGREPPMKDMTGQRAAYQCAVLNYRPPIPVATPEHVRPLIMRCWAPDPATRPSFVEIMEHLRHEPGTTIPTIPTTPVSPLSPSTAQRKTAASEPESEQLTWLRVAEILMDHLASRPPLWSLVDRGIVPVENAEYWIVGKRGPVSVGVSPKPPRLYHQVSDENIGAGPAALPPDSLAYDNMPWSAFESAQLDTKNNAAAPEVALPEEGPQSPSNTSQKPRGLSDSSLKDTYLEEQTWQEMSGPNLDGLKNATTKNRRQPGVDTKLKYQAVWDA